MGVVKRQSIKATIISYSGVGIAYLTLTVLFPLFLTESQIGLHRVIIQAGLVFAVLGAFGAPQTLVRFYSYFTKRKQEDSLFGLTLTLPLLGLTIFGLLFWGLKDWILSFFEKNAPEIQEYYYLALWITVCQSFYYAFSAFAQVFQRITVPRFFQEIIVRILTLVVLFFFVKQWITFETFLYLQPFIYGLMVVGVGVYAYLLRRPGIQFDLHHRGRRFLKILFSYSTYSLFTSASCVIVLAIDSFMVTGMLGLAEVGIYSIAFYIGQIIEMPKRSVVQLFAPMYSKAWFENDRETIQSLYQKSSINLMLLGGVFFLLIWLNLSDFYQIMPNGEVFSQGTRVVLFIALARWLDMAGGTNLELIANSKYYGYNLGVFSSLIVVAVICNLWLIPIYGITGAAIATFISLLCYNGIAFLLIKTKMGFQPFTKSSFKVLLVSGVLLFLISAIPFGDNPFIAIGLRSVVVVILFGLCTIVFKLSEEATLYYHWLQSKLKGQQ
jgi:O-antigen/teichoic acid export membrane protein